MHVENFVVCIVGKMAQENRNLFCDLFLMLFYKGMVRKRNERGGQGEDAWPVRYDSTELCCSQRKTVVVNSNAFN